MLLVVHRCCCLYVIIAQQKAVFENKEHAQKLGEIVQLYLDVAEIYSWPMFELSFVIYGLGTSFTKQLSMLRPKCFLK